MTTKTADRSDVPTRDLLVLLHTPWCELDKISASPLIKAGLLVYNRSSEQYDRTPAGQAIVDDIRQRHSMTFVDDQGGGRWHVQGSALHCGDPVEIMLSDGRWQRVRFEVEFRQETGSRNGRVPRFYLPLAGGLTMCCTVNWEQALFRVHEKRRR